MRRLLCRLVGHRWVPDHSVPSAAVLSDPQFGQIVGWECGRCGKRERVPLHPWTVEA